MDNIILAAFIAIGVRTIYKRFVLKSKLEIKWKYLIIFGTWTPILVNILITYGTMSNNLEYTNLFLYYSTIIVIFFLAIASILAIVRLIHVAEDTAKHVSIVYFLSLLSSIICIVNSMNNYDRNLIFILQVILILLQIITWKSLLAYLKKGNVEHKIMI